MENQKEARLFEIFWSFFKIGCFAFGGGFAMMPIIEREVVLRHHWLKSEDMVDIFAVAQAMPGAIAVNSLGIIGYKVRKTKGALVGILGVMLPAFLLITIIAMFFAQFKDIVIVQKAFSGIRASVVALIVYSAINLSKNTITDKLTALIAILSLVAVYFLKINAVFVIFGAVAIGLLSYFLTKRKKGEKDV